MSSVAAVHAQLTLLAEQRNAYINGWQGSVDTLLTDGHYLELCAQLRRVVMQLQMLLWGVAFFAPTLPEIPEQSLASTSLVTQLTPADTAFGSDEEKGVDIQGAWV